MRASPQLPQFLVISPPKTGSTWLAENLRRHPRIFVPPIKEVKYFSSLHQWMDLAWYASHFDGTEGQIAGEASPSYAPLPLKRIRAIRDLMPDVKLIFLMRDPVSRAWSHAKHMHRYREGRFSDCDAPLDQVANSEWRAAFADEWLLAAGDYLGHLRRWFSVFPRDRIHVEFFESIVERPEKLLRDVFSFLEVDPDIGASEFPLAERVLPGPAGELPPRLEESLRSLLGERAEELTSYLRDVCSLVPPAAWRRTLAARSAPSHPWPNFEEADVARIAAQESRFRTAYRQLIVGYRGFDLVFHRGRLLALAESPGSPEDLDQVTIERQIREGTILTAATLDELKERVTSRHLERMDALERELRVSREVAARLRIDLQTLVHEVRCPPPPAWKRTLRRFARRTARLFT